MANLCPSGHDNVADARFCEVCGSPIASTDSTTNQTLPSSPSAAERGLELYRLGQFDEAERWLKQAAYEGDGDAKSLVLLGKIAYLRGHHSDAERWWRRAGDRGNTAAMIYVAKAEEARAYIAGAKKWYQKAADAGDQQGLDALARLNAEDAHQAAPAVSRRRDEYLGVVEQTYKNPKSSETDESFSALLEYSALFDSKFSRYLTSEWVKRIFSFNIALAVIIVIGLMIDALSSIIFFTDPLQGLLLLIFIPFGVIVLVLGVKMALEMCVALVQIAKNTTQTPQDSLLRK